MSPILQAILFLIGYAIGVYFGAWLYCEIDTLIEKRKIKKTEKQIRDHILKQLERKDED